MSCENVFVSNEQTEVFCNLEDGESEERNDENSKISSHYETVQQEDKIDEEVAILDEKDFMIVEVNIEELPYICRSCLVKSDDTINIIQYSVDNVSLFEMYHSCCSIEVMSTDKLPQSMCKPCIEKLVTSYKFQLQSKMSEEMLRVKKADWEEKKDCNEDAANADPEFLTVPSLKAKEENVVVMEDPNVEEVSPVIDYEIESPGTVIYMDVNTSDKVYENGEESPEEYYEESQRESDEDKEGPRRDHQSSLVGFHLSSDKSFRNKCTICDINFYTYTSFVRHTQIFKHHASHGVDNQAADILMLSEEGLMHKCSGCDMEFDSKRDLDEHFSQHADGNPYQCYVCGKGFMEYDKLQIHVHAHNQKETDTSRCNHCGVTYKRSQLQKHLRAHLSEITEFIPAEEYNCYPCTSCDKVFNSEPGLKMHRTIQCNYPYLCAYCGKGHSSEIKLNAHVKTHLAADGAASRHFACSTCGKTFCRDADLQRHRLLHSPNNPQNCPYCPKSFETPKQLKFHLQKRHNTSGDTKPYVCTYCKKRFAFASSLKAHEATHAAVNVRYMCDVCDKGFYNYGMYTKHMENHLHAKGTVKGT